MQDAPTQGQTKRSPRISVDFPVILLFDNEGFRYQARQLSEFEILATPAYPELIEKKGWIKLILEPPNPSIFLSGIVIYANASGLGIRFQDISPDQQLRLISYLQACAIGVLKGRSQTSAPP